MYFYKNYVPNFVDTTVSSVLPVQEIELVIIRLEEETTASREEMERAAEARVRRVREKYETELREVERSERSTLEKFNSLKVCVSRVYKKSSTQNCAQSNVT